MPVFKYTVANKQGKNLNGNVEATDIDSARKELNNLGFSIISIEEAAEQQVQDDGQKFIFEAVDKNSQLITGTIPSDTKEEALSRLKEEYSLTVTAIWPQEATQEQINTARQEGMANLSLEKPEVRDKEDTSKVQSIEELREEQQIRAKIDFVLKKVHELLKTFGDKIEPDKRAEIEKKIDKLLRIKASTNIDYIIAVANDILATIQTEEKTLSQKGLEGDRLKLKINTSNLIDELKKSTKTQTVRDDIIQKINNWQSANQEKINTSTTKRKINNLLQRIKDFFVTPPEIQALKDQIKTYNKQLMQFTKLYFREKTPEYKEKIINSLKVIWKARRKAKHSLKHLKKLRKQRLQSPTEDSWTMSFTEELNTLTGWLLFFYILYYFTSLYISTKDFGFETIPKGFFVYESHIFKYILVTLFLFHSTSSIKINFFRKSTLASFILIPIFIFSTIVVIINF